MEYNGKTWTIDASVSDDTDHWEASDIDGSIYVPVTQLKEKLGASTFVDEMKKQISIMRSQDENDSSTPSKEPEAVANPVPVTTIPTTTSNQFPNGSFLFIWKANRIETIMGT